MQEFGDKVIEQTMQDKQNKLYEDSWSSGDS